VVKPRTLLIDNYDSYTFNLFQLLSVVYGTRPQVVYNDDPRLLELAARSDLAVISPGPGDPVREADFGLCAALLRESGLPVLGICLGHQGIAACAGGSVGRAPLPRHGHVSRIRHAPDPLFSGIPQDFSAVRYHSLRVREPLPPELIPLAWAEDDVLMALRHRDRPWWGVQFHPESVLTEYGGLLLANFRDAALPPRRPAVVPQARTYQAHVRVIDSEHDPEEVFACLFQPHDHKAWLDSPPGSNGRGRFSYLLLASDVLGEILSCRLAESVTTLEKVGSGFRTLPGSIFDALGRELAMRTIQAPELPFDFTGGFVGYFGYELKANCGARRVHRAASPDSMWLFPDRFVVFDHLSACAFLVALSDESRRTQDAALCWLDEAERVIRGTAAGEAGQVLPGADGEARLLAQEWLVRDRRRYLADVRSAQDKLLEGESYEICLTNTVRLPRMVEPWPYYQSLRRYNPAPYAAYIGTPGISVASSSPERFLKISRDRVVESKPIKGTAARGRSWQEDERLRRELMTSAKNRSENLMIVDLLRNDLGRVCVPGTVHVPLLMQVESYQTVHQLVSTVRGELDPGVSAVDCVRACFPGGSMTGAPKLRTMEIIDELETAARGVYSGSIGFLGCNGTADLSIAIRTAVFLPGVIHVGAGGAVVLDSDPEEEYEEMLLKAVAPLRALLACQRAATPVPQATS
jgi:para-aminobenzoate synthetase